MERGCPKSDIPTLLLLHPPPCSVPCAYSAKVGHQRVPCSLVLHRLWLTGILTASGRQAVKGRDFPILLLGSHLRVLGAMFLKRQSPFLSRQPPWGVLSGHALLFRVPSSLFRPRGGYNFIVVTPGRALAPPGAVYRVSVTAWQGTCLKWPSFYTRVWTLLLFYRVLS